MCGIAGYIGEGAVGEERIANALTALGSRGPDASACVVVHGEATSSRPKVVLLHTRLSIIDLDPRSNQPFLSEPYALIFNGEIYNYLELREELIARGSNFRTSSDTEVLLEAYRHYGLACLDKFEGMWSFALWDKAEQKLHLSRDRFSEKPLYYYRGNKGVYFASEVRALMALAGERFPINESHIVRYLWLGYKSLFKSDESFYSGVFHVPRASIMSISLDMSERMESYWKPDLRQKQISLDEAIEGARFHLFESLRIRLRSDVPLAFCLSGGVDSSALVSIAAKKFGITPSTFSIIDEDERYNEERNILATVKDLGCKHTSVKLSNQVGIDALRSLVRYHGAPILSISYFLHSMILEHISKAGFKVSFSGTAADELYTGYYDHYLLHLAEMDAKGRYDDFVTPWETHIKPLTRNSILRNPRLYLDNPNYREHVYDNATEFMEWINQDRLRDNAPGFIFYEEKYSDSILRNRMLNEIFHEATPLIVNQDDLNAMCYSVENRSPYLDRRLFEYMYSVPSEYLIHDGYSKYILRESVKGILNDTVRLDRQKKGFNGSIHSIIDLKDRNIREEFLNEKNEIFSYLDRAKVLSLFEEEELPNHYSKFLFSFISTSLFLEDHKKGATL